MPEMTISPGTISLQLQAPELRKLQLHRFSDLSCHTVHIRAYSLEKEEQMFTEDGCGKRIKGKTIHVD